MALFGLGAFGQGLVTGLATSADKAIQGGLERVRENIDEFSSATLKREQKAIEKTEKEAEEVIEELRSAQAVLGGTNDPQSAGRAAALLENIGDLDEFKSIVSQIKEHSFQDNISENYDFTKYFDTQVDAGEVNLGDAAVNYVMRRQLPTRATPTPEIKGGGIGRLFGVDVAERARAKTDAQLAALGLVKPQEKDIALPSITFKSEAFKLDRMDPEQERTYLKNKMLDPDTPQDKIEFYRTRYSDLSNRMGLDTQIESATFQLNLEQDPSKKKNMLLDLQKLNQQKQEFDILASGDRIKIKEFELSQALAEGRSEDAMTIRKELQGMGALTTSDIIAARTEQLYADLAEGKDVQAEIDSLKNLNEIVKTTKQQIEGMPDPTSAGTRAAYQNVSTMVNTDIVSNPKFAKAGVTISSTGALVVPDDINPNLKIEISNYRIAQMKKVAASMAGQMPNDPDIQLVVNMLGAGFSAEDVEALGEAEAVVTPEADTTLAETADAIPAPEIGFGVGLSEQDASEVASFVKGQHGGTLNDINVVNIVEEAAESIAEAATPSETAFGVEAPSINVGDVVAEATEAIEIAYGPEVAVEFAEKIQIAAEKAITPATEDITITRLGKPVTFRKVGDLFYSVDEEGNVSRTPVSRTSSLHEQLEAQTPYGQAVAAADRDEEQVDTSARLTGQARLIADIQQSTGTKPDVVADLGLAGKVGYRLVDGQFFRIKRDGELAESPADKIRSDDLRAIMGGTTQTDVEQTFDTYGERPRRTSAGGQPFMPEASAKGSNTITLATLFAKGQAGEAEINELKRRIESDTEGKVATQVQRIIDEVQAQQAD